MPTEFSFEYVFQAASPRTVIEAYFDPDHLAVQDVVAELSDRKVVENREDEKVRFTAWSVKSLRNLPMFVKPFVEGGRLSFRETMSWRKAEDEVDMTITPQVLGGRVSIAAVYTLTKVGDSQVRRRYKGTITAQVPLLSGKIERGILAEVDKGMISMEECTQKWLLGRTA